MYVFVYGGSLMNERGIHGRPALLRGYELRWVLVGVPPFEPSFGSIVPKEGGEVYGAVVEVPDEEWPKMRDLGTAYNDLEVRVSFLDGSGELDCLTMEPKPTHFREERLPSARYGRILREGAEHHGFPQDVIERYREVEKTGSRLSLRLRWLRSLVVWLTHIIGLPAAIAVVLLGLLGSIVGISLGLYWFLAG